MSSDKPSKADFRALLENPEGIYLPSPTVLPPNGLDKVYE